MRWRRLLDALLCSYVATVLTPALALSGALKTLHPAPDVGLLFGTGIVIAVSTMVTVRFVDDVATVLSTLPAVSLTVLPPLAYFPYLLFATTPQTIQARYCVVGFLAIVPGVFVVIGAGVLRNYRRRADATEVTVVTLGTDDGGGASRLAAVGAIVAGFGSIVAGALVLLGTDSGMGVGVLTAMGGSATTLLQFAGDGETEVAVTDRGLRIDRALLPWESCAGYRVTDDTIILVRDAWYHPDRRIERDGSSDGEELRMALQAYLPGLDDHGRVEVPVRR